MRSSGGRLEKYCRLGAGIRIADPKALNVSTMRVRQKIENECKNA